MKEITQITKKEKRKKKTPHDLVNIPCCPLCFSKDCKVYFICNSLNLKCCFGDEIACFQGKKKMK